MSTNQRAFTGWRPNYNNTILQPSNKQPFKTRRATSFQRPPAKYDNRSWEETVARVELLPEPQLKNKKAKK